MTPATDWRVYSAFTLQELAWLQQPHGGIEAGYEMDGCHVTTNEMLVDLSSDSVLHH